MVRFSKIKVYDFNIEKLIQVPAISCSENTIYMTCPTPGAVIYYKIGSGEFTKYTSPIVITDDVTVVAYATGGTQTSSTVTETIYYDDGIVEPVIVCDGERVEITCETMGADIYYRIGTSGNFTLYSEPFEIS